MQSTFSRRFKSLGGSVNLRALLPDPRKLALAAIDLYALSMSLYAGLRLAGANELPQVYLIGTFSHLLLLPAFVLLPLMLLRRRWPVVMMLGVCVAAFIALFGGMFLPKGHAAPAGATVIKAMTFNVAGYTRQPDEIVKVLRESGADIIAMQEFDLYHGAAVDGELAEIYPYRATANIDHTFMGKAIISRYPIIDQEAFYVIEDRVQLQVIVDIDGQHVQVFDFHPPPPGRARFLGIRDQVFTYDEFNSVLERIRPDLPVIILCDCNVTSQGQTYRLFKDAGFTDAFAAAGQGFGLTHPGKDGPLASVPTLVRVDYVWASEDFLPLKAYVGDGTGSDHFPVIAELALKQSR